MRKVHAKEFIKVPKDIKIEVKARTVTVTGPRGKLTRSFKHVPCDIRILPGKVQVEIWFGTTVDFCCLRTVCSHIKNMVLGVTQGFEYRLRMVYAHFPISASITNSDKTVEIRNFLGEKVTRKVNMLEGVTVSRGTAVKDELILRGNDIDNVAQSAALIYQSCFVKYKDIRKFLDGIYISKRGLTNLNDEAE